MTNPSSLGQAWLLEAYTNDTLKGNFHFVQLSSKYANQRSAWHIRCANSKLHSVLKLLDNLPTSSLYFPAQYCIVRQRGIKQFLKKFLAHVSWYEVILSESHPNLIPSVVILHEAEPKRAGWRLDSALFLIPPLCMEARRGQHTSLLWIFPAY